MGRSVQITTEIPPPASMIERLELPEVRRKRLEEMIDASFATQGHTRPVPMVAVSSSPEPEEKLSMRDPFAAIHETFDVLSAIEGGVPQAQADAVKLGLARALMEFNKVLRDSLAGAGFVARGPRAEGQGKKTTKGRPRRIVVANPPVASRTNAKAVLKSRG